MPTCLRHVEETLGFCLRGLVLGAPCRRVTLATDASLSGWGVVMSDHLARGLPDLRDRHVCDTWCMERSNPPLDPESRHVEASALRARLFGALSSVSSHSESFRGLRLPEAPLGVCPVYGV